MHEDIQAYNEAQPAGYREICCALAEAIDAELENAESKVWHRAPVWFIDANPIVGYWVRKGYVQLLFWSGQSFDDPALKPEGKFRAAELRISDAAQIEPRDLQRWLRTSQRIQWDYKNLVKRRGVLEKIGDW